MSFDEIFITGCTESYHFDNFRCSLWWRFCQNDISVSVRDVSEEWNIFRNLICTMKYDPTEAVSVKRNTSVWNIFGKILMENISHRQFPNWAGSY